jgi:hypothetical protein
MPQSTQAAGQAAWQSARPGAEEYGPELADFAGAGTGWNGFELTITPEFHLRMVVWSLSLSSVLWCSLIAAGHELLKVWR